VVHLESVFSHIPRCDKGVILPAALRAPSRSFSKSTVF
jgi:hypothetical protein